MQLAISPACPEHFVFSWLIGLTSQSLRLPTKARPSLPDHFSPLYLLILNTPDSLLSHLESRAWRTAFPPPRKLSQAHFAC